MMAEQGFLQREYFHIPMWGWIVGAVGVIFLVMKYKGGTAAQSATTPTAAQSSVQGNNGNAPAPSIFFLPNGTYNTPQPSQVSVTINRHGHHHRTGVHTPGSPPPADNPPPDDGSGDNSPPPDQNFQTVTVQKWPGTSDASGNAEWDTTLWGIANHFGQSVGDLATLNGIQNPDLIYPGQQIKVPV